MSNLIDRLKNDGTGRHEHTKEVLKYPSIKYRTLYFENLVDVRTCSKNGGTTLRAVWSELFTGEKDQCTTSIRKHIYEKNLSSGLIEPGWLMFRKYSYKVAVKRDPIERALSTAKYLCKARLGVDPTLELVEEFLSIASPDIDQHFLSQTFWMGTPDLYDEVYDLQDLDVMIEWLEQDFDYQYPVTAKVYNQTTKEISISHLSDDTIKRLYKMYEIDYDNGWY